MNLPKSVAIVEVGPRDGLQNESEFIPANVKIDPKPSAVGTNRSP